MLIGSILNVVNAYYYTRPSHEYISINKDVKLNKNKFYASVVVQDNIIEIRNIFHETVEETNIHFKDLFCENFKVSDDTGIINKWIRKNQQYNFYIVEYKPNVCSINVLKLETDTEIENLQGRLEILERLKEKIAKPDTIMSSSSFKSFLPKIN
jgi:hypothetical protein